MGLTKDDKKYVCDVWSHINCEQVGGDALIRLICVDPWTRRYFLKFGDLSCAEAIIHNAHLAAHGVKVLKSIGDAITHIDDLRGHYADLSAFHSKKFHVDPANFWLFAGIVSVTVGMALGEDYTAHKQACFERFLHDVCRALSHGYY